MALFQKLRSARDIRTVKQAKNTVIPVKVTLAVLSFVKKALIDSNRATMEWNSIVWRLVIFGESQVLDQDSANKLVSIQKFILSWIGFTPQ